MDDSYANRSNQKYRTPRGPEGLSRGDQRKPRGVRDIARKRCAPPLLWCSCRMAREGKKRGIHLGLARHHPGRKGAPALSLPLALALLALGWIQLGGDV